MPAENPLAVAQGPGSLKMFLNSNRGRAPGLLCCLQMGGGAGEVCALNSSLAQRPQGVTVKLLSQHEMSLCSILGVKVCGC